MKTAQSISKYKEKVAGARVESLGSHSKEDLWTPAAQIMRPLVQQSHSTQPVPSSWLQILRSDTPGVHKSFNHLNQNDLVSPSSSSCSIKQYGQCPTVENEGGFCNPMGVIYYWCLSSRSATNSSTSHPSVLIREYIHIPYANTRCIVFNTKPAKDYESLGFSSCFPGWRKHQLMGNLSTQIWTNWAQQIRTRSICLIFCFVLSCLKLGLTV